MCCKYSGEIIPAAITSLWKVNIANDKFLVKSIFKYFGDAIGQCGGCSDAVSTRIVALWKAFRELLPVLTNRAIQTKLCGNVYSSLILYCKILLHSGSFLCAAKLVFTLNRFVTTAPA